MWSVFYLSYGIRSSQATADLLKVVSGRSVRVYNRSRATRGVALDMSKVCQSLAYCYFSRGQVL